MSDPSTLIQGIYEFSVYLKEPGEEYDEKTIKSIRKLLSLLLSQTEHNDIKGLTNIMQNASLDIDYFQFGRFLYSAMRHYYLKWPELAGMTRTEKNWIQCSACSRWRIVSPSESIKYSGNEQWYCSLNQDLLFSDCRLPEEFPDSETDPRRPMPYSVFLFTRYFLTKDAVEFLVEAGCSANVPEKAEKIIKTLAVKRELSTKATKKAKKTKMFLRSELTKEDKAKLAKTLVSCPPLIQSPTTITAPTTTPPSNAAPKSALPTANLTVDVNKKWKAQDEVSVLWMNGEYKEAIIVGAPNKGDAFLVRLIEDEDQMYTIKAERIHARIPKSTSTTVASTTMTSNESSEDEFMLDEFHIYEADVPFNSSKTNTTTTPSAPVSSTINTTNTQTTTTKEIEQRQQPSSKPSNLSELSDLEDESDTKWDYEEEGRLLIAIEKFGFNWEQVSDYVASKSTVECRDRWKYHARMLSEFVHQPISD